MRVAQELKVCSDCLQVIANGPDGVDFGSARLAEIEAGLARLGRHVVAGSEDFGFMRRGCDCCEDSSYGERYAAAVLEPEETLLGKPADTAPLVELIAASVAAAANCRASGNADWLDIHESRIAELLREYMPSGSGFDSGTELDADESTADKLVFTTSFHHMSESGSYSGWTQHRVIVTPSFVGRFNIKVTGRDKNAIRDYIADTFAAALSQEASRPG